MISVGSVVGTLGLQDEFSGVLKGFIQGIGQAFGQEAIKKLVDYARAVTDLGLGVVPVPENLVSAHQSLQAAPRLFGESSWRTARLVFA